MTVRSGFKYLPVLALVALGAPAHATELVQNGNFEQTLVAGSSEFGSYYPSQQVTGWKSTGYNFVYTPGTADTTGGTSQYGAIKLWGPGNGAANGLPATSPTGGNFIAADGAYEVGAISQTITGLTGGDDVMLTFYWAGAQQYNFSGATTDQWKVSLGAETHSTNVVSDPNHGFTGWVKQTMIFEATAASEVLSFLAVGTPSGEPPFALLDGVSATVVPEPMSWAIMAAGLVGLGGFARLHRKSATKVDKTV